MPHACFAGIWQRWRLAVSRHAGETLGYAHVQGSPCGCKKQSRNWRKGLVRSCDALVNTQAEAQSVSLFTLILRTSAGPSRSPDLNPIKHIFDEQRARLYLGAVLDLTYAFCGWMGANPCSQITKSSAKSFPEEGRLWHINTHGITFQLPAENAALFVSRND